MLCTVQLRHMTIIPHYRICGVVNLGLPSDSVQSPCSVAVDTLDRLPLPLPLPLPLHCHSTATATTTALPLPYYKFYESQGLMGGWLTEPGSQFAVDSCHIVNLTFSSRYWRSLYCSLVAALLAGRCTAPCTPNTVRYPSTTSAHAASALVLVVVDH